MALPNVNECTHAKQEQALKILALDERSKLQNMKHRSLTSDELLSRLIDGPSNHLNNSGRDQVSVYFLLK